MPAPVRLSALAAPASRGTHEVLGRAPRGTRPGGGEAAAPAPVAAGAVAGEALERRGAVALCAAIGAAFLGGGSRPARAGSISLADFQNPPQARVALFSAGDARFLQPAFENIRYKGISKIEVGRMDDGTRAVRVTYNPKRCSFKQLLGAFLKNIDPTDGGGQFGDRGAEFRPVVWVADPAERQAAETGMKIMEDSGVYGPVIDVRGKLQGGKISQRPVVPFSVDVLDAREFEPRPQDGQDFYKEREGEYEKLRKSSRREAFFSEKYTPVSTTSCEGSVCGFVYFPCTPDNGCTNVINGDF